MLEIYVNTPPASNKEFNFILQMESNKKLNIMKKLFFLLGIVMICFAFTSIQGINEVAAALKSGSANSVAKYFDSKVELTIGGKSSTYNKAQATAALQSFFSTNTVKGFSIKHQGDNAGSEYCIGTLSTSSGDFRTTFYLNKKAGDQNLQEIRFE